MPTLIRCGSSAPDYFYWRLGKVKVKCTLVQALRLCTGRTVHRESRGIAVLFLDHGTTRGWGVSITPRPLFTPGKDQVPVMAVRGNSFWMENTLLGIHNLRPVPKGRKWRRRFCSCYIVRWKIRPPPPPIDARIICLSIIFVIIRLWFIKLS